MAMRDRIESVGGRRYVLAWGSLMSASILQYLGKLDVAGTAYGITIGVTVAAYITGNVAQRKHDGDRESRDKE